MPFTWFVAFRYLIDGRRQTLLILAAASTGVAVIVFVYALISGLQTNLIGTTLGSQAHIVISAPDEAARPLWEKGLPGTLIERIEKGFQRPQSINEWSQVLTALEQIPGVMATAPLVSGSAFVQRGNTDKSIMLRGVVPAEFDRIIPLSESIVAGSFSLSGIETVIGVELAKELGAWLGDKLRIVMSDGRSEVLSIAGVFDLNNKDINHRWVFVSLRMGQSLLDLSGGITTINVKISDIFQARQMGQTISDRTGLKVESWMELNEKLLIGLRSQNSSSYMIQIFVMVAVAFGIASVLIVSVVQKQREIGIMRAFGVSRSTLKRIFLIQGALLGLSGSLLGSIFGSGLALFFEGLAREADGSPRFPVDLSLKLYLTAALITTAVGVLSAYLPARESANVDPVQVIR